jgi:hypothetical protein
LPLAIVAISFGGPAAWSQEGCTVDRVPGGVDIAIAPVGGDVVVASAGLRIYLSIDGGASFWENPLPYDGSWPSVAFRDDELFLAAGRWGSPNEIFLLRSEDGGTTFELLSTIRESASNRMIDPEILVLSNGRMLVFLTEVFSNPVSLHDFVVRPFSSDDGGLTWFSLPAAVLGPRGIKIEDSKAVELGNGDILLAYEFEIEDLGESRIEQIRSVDQGQSWGPPTVLWNDVPLSDNEPGGYQLLQSGALWFLASTDEDVVEGYSDAVVKGKLSVDGGLTWGPAIQLVPEPDQIVYGSAVNAQGHLLLATVRHYQDPPRSLNVYHVDPDAPGPRVCRPLVFVGTLDSGTLERWSVHHP